jgi:epsilon-lactone hydrolase
MNANVRDVLRQTLAAEVAPAFGIEVPLEQQRLTLEAMGAAAEPADGTAVEQRPLAGMPAEWITSPGCRGGRALLHLHGGGYVMGSCGSHRALASRIGAAAGAGVALPEYRLAPEHPFPAALEDGVAAYRALVAGGVAPDDIVLVGDSAGGGLVLATLVALRDAGDPLPAGAVLLSPLTDLTASGESMRTRADSDPWLSPALLDVTLRPYVGGADRADPRLSPLFADLRGLPPLLIQVGDQEILLSDATRLAERAQAAGVEVTLEVWPEVWHVWHLFAPQLPDANEALDRIGAFVRGRLGN